jgi:hypothetical protein
MGREVRMVPPDWKHPEGKSLLMDFSKRVAEWDDDFEHWKNGEVVDYSSYPEKKWQQKNENQLGFTFDCYNGERPVQDDYMPEWPADVATHFMMYETVSEGSPISPAFATPEDLARWLADTNASAFGSQRASYEHWHKMIVSTGWAPSAFISGDQLKTGVAGIGERKQ